MVRDNKFEAMFIVGPIIMALFGYILMNIFVFDLVDSIWDDGDAIIIRNKGKEDRVSLANISKVSCSSFTNPTRMTLTLREGSLFGEKIVFIPFFTWHFTTHPLAKELIQRIDEKRKIG